MLLVKKEKNNYSFTSLLLYRCNSNIFIAFYMKFLLIIIMIVIHLKTISKLARIDILILSPFKFLLEISY